LLGAGVVLWDPAVGLPVPASLGDWLGVAGGMGFAMVNVILRRQAGTPATDRALAMSVGGLVIPLLLTPVLLSVDLISMPPPLAADWVQALIGFALVMLVANLMLQYGASRLPSRVTSIVLLSEVLVAALSAAWFAGEALEPRVLAGGSLIMLASLLAARAR
jgi:drug/metabolite transporter (DMT)-like permease